VNVVGYCRVSTAEQGRSGLGLEAQRDAIRAACTIRGWDEPDIRTEVKSGGRASNRPVLRDVLRDLKRGDVLVVAKLDRLARSTADFLTIAKLAQRRGWALVLLDLGLDTSTPMGEAMATVVAAFATLERKLIGQRIAEALAVKRANGWRPDRPQLIPAPVRERICQLADRGVSQREIARRLNEEGAPAVGAKWHRETISRVLRTR